MRYGTGVWSILYLVVFCGVFTRIAYSYGVHSGLIMANVRSFLANMEEFEIDEMSTAEHLDEAVNAIFAVISQQKSSCLFWRSFLLHEARLICRHRAHIAVIGFLHKTLLHVVGSF